MPTREEIQARREARRDELSAAREAQELADLEVIDSLEERYGDSNIAVLKVNFALGLPALVAVRTPKPAEIKRYQDKIRPSKKGEVGNLAQATEQVGTSCMVYPAREDPLRESLLEHRAAMAAVMGLAALKLSEGAAEEEGKE